jgi:hypothetical protein
MNSEILIFTGGILTVVWGVAHFFPARNVVKGFGEIPEENKNIITIH